MLMKLRQRMRKAQNQQGFTLVELMVVVVILGILVAIAVPVYNAQAAKAEKSACQANQRIVDSAIMQYKIDNPSSTGQPAMSDLVGSGKYMQVEPRCPSQSDTAYGIPAAGALTTCTHSGHARTANGGSGT